MTTKFESNQIFGKSNKRRCYKFLLYEHFHTNSLNLCSTFSNTETCCWVFFRACGAHTPLWSSLKCTVVCEDTLTHISAGHNHGANYKSFIVGVWESCAAGAKFFRVTACQNEFLQLENAVSRRFRSSFPFANTQKVKKKSRRKVDLR